MNKQGEGIVYINPIEKLDDVIESLDGKLSDKLDDYTKNKEVVQKMKEEYAKARRECEEYLNRRGDQFAKWIDKAKDIQKSQELKMKEYLGDVKPVKKSSPLPIVPVSSSVWNNFVPANSFKSAPGKEPKPLINKTSEKKIHMGSINGVEIGPVCIVNSLSDIPNMIVYQLKPELEDPKRSKFFYIRINGHLIQSTIPKRQKQGKLRKYLSCHHVKPGNVRCKEGADNCQFYHCPFIDAKSTDTRNYPALARYISAEEFSSYGDSRSSAYTDNIGDIDELANDVENIDSHDIFILAQRTLSSILCVMAASKYKKISYVPE